MSKIEHKEYSLKYIKSLDINDLKFKINCIDYYISGDKKEECPNFKGKSIEFSKIYRECLKIELNKKLNKNTERYLFVKSIMYYYDGHGCPDKGETIINVGMCDGMSYFAGCEEGEVYSKYQLDYLKGKDDNDLEFLCNNLVEGFGAEDGYNSTDTSISIKIISKEEFESYNQIIKDYKKLEQMIKV